MLSRYRLPNQEEGEKIIKIIRRDIFILIKKIFLFSLLSILPLIFLFLMVQNDLEILNGQVAWPLMILGISAYYLSMWLLFFFAFVDYYLDTWIVTNMRIISIEQKGLFSRVISEQKIYRVQDVTSETNGILPTIFAYGSVYIQTAGEQERFHFEEVPNPDAIRDLIIKLAEENKKEEIKEAITEGNLMKD
jgi:membrane protein YdbS with pleckstrin-like domain